MRLVLLLPVVFSAACSLDFNEGSQSKVVMSLDSSKDNCLSNTSGKLKLYFSGEGNSKEIKDLFNCAEKSLDLFIENTKGAEEGKYKVDELVKFLEYYFYEDEKISSGLVSEFMHLKKFLLGGSIHSFSVDELRKLQDLLKVFKSQMVNVEKFMPFKLSVLLDKKPEFIDEFSKTVNSSIDAMVNVINETNSKDSKDSKYSFTRFGLFLNELERVYESEGEGNGPRYILDNLSFFTSVYHLVTGSDENVFHLKDLKEKAKLLSKNLFLFLKITHFKENYKEFSYGKGLERLSKVFNEFKVNASDVIKLYPKKAIPFKKVYSVMDQLEHYDHGAIIKSSPVSFEVIKRLIPTIFYKILLGGSTKAITERSLNTLYQSVDGYIEGQKYLYYLYSRTANNNRTFNPYRGVRVTSLMRFSNGEMLDWRGEFNSSYWVKMNEFKKDIKAYRPFYTKNTTVISIDPEVEPNDEQYSFYSLSQLNFVKSIVRTLMRGYYYYQDLEKVKPHTPLVLERHIDEFYRDFREFSLKIKFLDPRAKEPAKERFMEANHFVSHSNGDGYASEEESIEYFTTLVSIGNLTRNIHREMESHCPSGPTGVRSWQMIQQECFREKFTLKFSDYFSAFPSMVRYFRGLNSNMKKEFITAIENAVIDDRDPKNKVDFSVNESIVSLLHFVESLFYRFDANLSGSLDAEEVLAAYPVFKNYLSEVSGLKNNSYLEALMTFLIKNGRPPKKATELWWWKMRRYTWEFESDRMQVIKVFSSLSQLGKVEVSE